MSRWLPAGLLIGLSASALAAEPPNTQAQSYSVPYRLTATKHLLVRVKINGKGPFHFIADTGAPSLYVSTAVARSLGIKADDNDWATFDRFEIEGGAVLRKVRGRVEDPFQLEGMNSLGLAGVKVDGILGYSVLARFRLEVDLTRDTMTWSKVKPPPTEAEQQGKQIVPPGMEAVVSILKLLGNLGVVHPPAALSQRGFLGVEVEERDGQLAIKAVGADTPAQKAGLNGGDVVRRIQGARIRTYADALRRLAALKAGDTVELVIERRGESRTLAIRLEEGL